KNPIFATRPAPGKPQNVSKNDTEVKKAVLIATYSFNNKSNDAFFFKASAIDKAQRQIVKGIKYILKVEISRTVCKKREVDTDLAKCNFQPKRQLQQ
ncbi:cystatin-F-like isoform X2, partial [Clarias magur]